MNLSKITMINYSYTFKSKNFGDFQEKNLVNHQLVGLIRKKYYNETKMR